jgi:histidyl-tRNA synthetase
MKPSLPQGTRDFGPETVRKRNFIFDTLRSVFELYGFQPLETPALENLDTLMGKYGEEGDKLIFKILNNGLNDPKNISRAREAFEHVLEGKNDKGLTERALKYDLTIPFARYVAMNQGQLNYPFKRYQMQPVWRADRPQRGRYREFYQCDADVVGSPSLLNEVELASIYSEAFEKLGIKVIIRVNNRKILAGLAAKCGGPDQLIPISTAIDKLDKIGLQKVKEELAARGLDSGQVSLVEKYLSITGTNAEKLQQAGELLGGQETGKKGLEELEFLLDYPLGQNASLPLEVDFTLARGLNYYTGIIYEVKALSVNMGSIGGGGRYDDLTGLFGVPNIAGVGISFGVDRIFDVMEELGLFPAGVLQGPKALFLNLGQKESQTAYRLLLGLRKKGIPAEIYPEQAKFEKQFRYADKKGIPFAIIIGSQEMASGTCLIKKLATGEQLSLSQSGLSGFAF